MKVQVTDDLMLEIWRGADGGTDHDLVKLRSLALERDAEVAPGAVTIYCDEIDALIAGLISARRLISGVAE